MKAVRVGNTEVEHLALIDDTMDVALHSLCDEDGWFPVIETKDATLAPPVERLVLCPACGQLLHDLTLLADPPAS